MRAVWLSEFGGPEVLVAGEAPAPVPAPGQALIEVEYANITFVETELRADSGAFRLEVPVIRGNGVGGFVSAVGAGVDPGLGGRRVVSSMGGSGGYAELAVVDAGALVEVPEGVALDESVALVADGRTAVSLVRTVGLGEGDRA
ncbi:MAG: NADPH:quinone reductase, partial [Thermoleophilaceae bacterium]